jgi:hypothetical protein
MPLLICLQKNGDKQATSLIKIHRLRSETLRFSSWRGPEASTRDEIKGLRIMKNVTR